jgi:poly-gamma-glutamate synthesis protein (capsule biosynthesis protein)
MGVLLALAVLVGAGPGLVGCSGDDGTTAGEGGADGASAAAGEAGESGESGEAGEVATTAPPPRSFTLAATGDVLLHMPVMRVAEANGGGVHDFSPMFAEVSDEIAGADWAICHLETPISRDGTDLSGYPMFNAAPEIAPDLAAAGYDACDTASNHTLDRGAAGVQATLDVLDEAGLVHTGSARSADEAANPPISEVNGVRLGHLAYTYDTNGIPLPAGQPWAVNVIDVDRVLADAAALEGRGAEFVVVSLQWGAEYQTAPTETQREQARALLASPHIDLVLGSHVHVVQPIERIGDEYVVYGMGNFLSNQSAAAGLRAQTQDGVIIHATVTETDAGFRVSELRYTPTFVTRPNYVIQVADPAVHPDSYGRTTASIDDLGPGAHDARPTVGDHEPPAVGPSSMVDDEY